MKSEKIKLRVEKPVQGIYPSMQPELGKEYAGNLYTRTKKSDPAEPFAVIEVRPGKPLILREGEFVEVG